MSDMRRGWRQSGLTLLELLVVVTLLGFVAATVTVRLSGRLGQAAMGQALAQWEFTDAQLRLRARRKRRPVSLHLEVGSNRLECAFDTEDDAARTVRSLGGGVKLAKFVSATREVTYGPVTIEYGGCGTSETFAVELEGKDVRRWVLVAGITGQTTEVTDARQVEQLLEQLVPASVHAD